MLSLIQEPILRFQCIFSLNHCMTYHEKKNLKGLSHAIFSHFVQYKEFSTNQTKRRNSSSLKNKITNELMINQNITRMAKIGDD